MYRNLHFLLLILLVLGCTHSPSDSKLANKNPPASRFTGETQLTAEGTRIVSENEPDALAKWTRNDLVGRPIVYSISENLNSLHSFKENGTLEIAMERNGEQTGVTNWKWMIDSAGILVATCEEPRMTAKFKLLARLDEGFEIEQTGETNGETIEPTTIRWKYLRAIN